jgi:tRNA G18 (ribose-2'-O)-methylase SpoU
MRKLGNEELNRLSIEDFRQTEKIPVVVVLDNVRSMNNIGSVFRTADAFLIHSVVLCGITATPPHRDIHKTALGATESVTWTYCKDTEEAIERLKADNFTIIAIEQTEGSLNLREFFPARKEKYALVFGHEVRGVQQKIVDRCDVTLDIPQYGTKHSLNISVCAGIVLWDFFQKLTNKKSG